MQENKFEIMKESIRKLIRRGATANLIKILKRIHPADIAHLFRYLNHNEKKIIFALVKDPEKAATVLSETDPGSISELLADMKPEELSNILKYMPSDDAADIIGSLPDEIAEKVLESIRGEESEDIEELLKYDEDTAGGIMTPDYFALNEDVTAKEAIEALRKVAEVEMVFYIYVIDDRHHLIGVVSLRQLLIVSPNTPLKKIMSTDVTSVNVHTDQEEVAILVARYNILAIPVVDGQNKLAGIITVDDVIDVIREEATEDIYKMAGINDEELVYGDEIFKIAKIRLPWLITNLLGGFVSGWLLWLFKVTLKDVIALVTFIPVITGMGGNIGTQSSSIVVRGLATGRIDLSRIGKVLFKEVRVGALMGLICGMSAGAVGVIWHGNLILGIVVAISMFTAITVAASMGTLTPAFFKKMKIDPAVASGPFVTTSNDIIGLLIYFGLATMLLKYLR